MDSSKILPGSEECSSSESGWTTYIASPDLEQDPADNEDDDDDDRSIGQQGYKKGAAAKATAAEDADSDDSMASDASSGPSDQRFSYGFLGRSLGFGHAANKDQRKSVAKKHNQQEEKKKQKKGEKDNSGNRANSAGRLKKF
ncbi:hypothetical protein C2S52_020400 [Perilla frutescens var. hirtella]|uniref:Uncharacterized protein n=1 Tax=Perilla frutescens var. hirtella TaxID=608512 RepID=A0AAD4JD82_PERFH|nr:hypothetical protein C2S52_020400 [Perilla frutescens var. hirtella]KAH6802149.1 hypothetical protein C2S51_033595 [Perilla frutescens var. frutescens]KAH6805436.1 hypothetical protein C2S51_030267 [Perilla frutescens var. frutescens]KAH6831674.1 hypothetical protein C2S53_008756 [Perilla frutescens var. hirtella]